MKGSLFGAFVSDELKMIHARAKALDLRHGARIVPQDPMPDEPVTITVTVGPGASVEDLVCYYTTDGQEPIGSHGTAHVGEAVPLQKKAIEWHLFLWGYVEPWKATLPPQPEGTIVQYRIGGSPISDEDGDEVWADWPQLDKCIQWTTAAFVNEESISDVAKPAPSSSGSSRSFAYSVDRLTPPQWVQDAVVYQVFIDRFISAAGGDDRRLRLGALVQMTLPGQSIIYYGTEVGLSQERNKEAGEGADEARIPMVWGDEQDRDLLSWYRRLIAARRAHPAIWEGERDPLLVDSTVWCYPIGGVERQIPLALNVGPNSRRLHLEPDSVPGASKRLVRVGSARVDRRDGVLLLDLPSRSGGIWIR